MCTPVVSSHVALFSVSIGQSGKLQLCKWPKGMGVDFGKPMEVNLLLIYSMGSSSA